MKGANARARNWQVVPVAITVHADVQVFAGEDAKAIARRAIGEAVLRTANGIREDQGIVAISLSA